MVEPRYRWAFPAAVTLGPDLLTQLAQKSGLSVEDLTHKLAQVLPQAVDKLTPEGRIPDAR